MNIPIKQAILSHFFDSSVALSKAGLMDRLVRHSVNLIVIVASCILFLVGCSSLIIHSDDNVPTVAAKVTVRTINCVLTVFGFCMSEWWLMEDVKNASMVWYGNGDINGDNYTCQKEATYSSSGSTGYMHMPIGQNVVSVPMASGGGQQINQQLYHSCMRARGYQLYDSYELNKWQQSVAQQRQAEYNNLVAEKNVLDNLKGTLDEQHRVLVDQKQALDHHSAALPGGLGTDQYQQALTSYNRDLGSYNQKLAEYTSRVELLNKRVAIFNK
ncbi:MAG: hypothetical protein U0319_03395 [Nitrospira sp.]